MLNFYGRLSWIINSQNFLSKYDYYGCRDEPQIWVETFAVLIILILLTEIQ